jgi:outer membrane protein OmpA-like peptidoglycan-associated protein
MKLTQAVTGAGAVCLLAPFTWAQTEAGASASFDTAAAGPAEASAAAETAEPPPEPPPAEPAPEPEPAPEVEAAPAAAAAGTQVPYMQRYKPEAMVWEMGLFTGLFLPSAGLPLYSAQLPYVAYGGAAFELGGRVGFYPLSFLGVEAEFAWADGFVQEDLEDTVDPRLVANDAMFNAYRGQVVGQLPFWSIVPFVTAGVTVLGATSQTLGHGSSAAFHFGLGAKVPITKEFAIRVDLRENMMGRSNASYGGLSFSEEILVGGTVTFGRKATPLPAAVAEDADGDTVPDETDACPEVAALTPDGCPGDLDQDGVLDPDDHCPREAGTTAEGCPDPDPDKDGVPLPCDMCPDDVGVKPGGCPILDADADGIIDQVDECPKDPETKNGFEDENGCPDEIPKEVSKFTGSIPGITFVQGSPKIEKKSDTTLTACADVLAKYPSIKLEITGHTSNEGSKTFNQKLSEDRAGAVRDWLIDHGVEGERLAARGVGSDSPVADNKTAAGREKNRRIEFEIVMQ